MIRYKTISIKLIFRYANLALLCQSPEARHARVRVMIAFRGFGGSFPLAGPPIDRKEKPMSSFARPLGFAVGQQEVQPLRQH